MTARRGKKKGEQQSKVNQMPLSFLLPDLIDCCNLHTGIHLFFASEKGERKIPMPQSCVLEQNNRENCKFKTLSWQLLSSLSIYLEVEKPRSHHQLVPKSLFLKFEQGKWRESDVFQLCKNETISALANIRLFIVQPI